MRIRPLFAALTLALCLPVVAQDEEGYFSLSSGRTFGPDEKAFVNLSAVSVESLDFRVYRVNNPVRFFQKLDEPHSFGEQTARPDRALTPIERFHRMKRQWQARMRNVVRTQFTGDVRAGIRDRMAERPGKSLAVSHYADAPLLNPQQVVSVWKQPVSRAGRWESQSIPIETPGPGVYLVEAAHGDLRAYTILIVSDLVMVTKTSPGRLLTYLADRKTGTPASAIPVLVWAKEKPVVQLSSDRNGIADIRLAGVSADDTFALARRGDHVAVSSIYPYLLTDDPERAVTAYLYTDRPVYRPGHKVQFKGILRTRNGAGYRLPEQREVSIEVQDPESKPVYRKTLAVSAMGTIHGELDLPQNAALGYYSLEARIGSATRQGGFQVEEYRKPEYEVRVTPSRTRVLQGETVEAVVDARYYYGEPVAGAKVTYVVHRSRNWDFGDEEPQEQEDEAGYGSEQVLEEKGQLDAEGKLTIRIPTALHEEKHDLRYRVEARVTDEGKREIAGNSSFLATYGSFKLTVRSEKYIYGPGEKAGLAIEARDYDGKPVRSTVRAELLEWRSREQGWGRALASAEAATDETGKARVELPVARGGSFQVRVTARTPEGREVADTTYLWVSGASASFYGEDSESLQIVPDKPSYRPGDTARLMLLTGGAQAGVLVTTEGRELQTVRVVSSTASTVTVDVPILPEHVPNFYVSAVFLRAGKLYQGTKRIKVPPDEQQLSVEITPSKNEYQPGEQAEFTVKAQDHLGKPVSAEFSLGIVDEAIYAIRKDQTPGMSQFFYGNLPNSVNTDSSLSYYFHGQAGRRRMQLTQLARRTTLAQLKPDRLVQPKIRKAFPDTAYWAANLTTDAAGKATARLSFPDSLTQWRATARGVTSDTRVGSAVRRTVVRKNMVLSLAVPRFLTQGDEVTVSALVRNYLPAEKTARVSLEAKGLDTLDGATRDVAIPSRGSVTINWRMRAQNVRNVTLLGKALTDQESDAVELELPVNPPGVKLSQARAGSFASGGEAAFPLTFPPEAASGSRMLEISVNSSIAGTLFSALDYLTGFPYGCVEQTMSSFLPNLVVSQATRQLGLAYSGDPALLKKQIKAGMERLLGFQHEDGGWGWWETDESNVFMTAYVITGLQRAQAEGQTVPRAAIDRGAEWLRGTFASKRETPADLRAYTVYSLVTAGKNDPGLVEAVWNDRRRLTPYGQAFLGLAFDLTKDKRADELALQLESSARLEGQEASWPGSRDELLDFPQDVTPETTSYALKLLVKRRPQSPVLEKAALWLMNHRNEGSYWSSTKQTAMVIYGLVDYVTHTGELKSSLDVSVSLNGREVMSEHISPADALAIKPRVLRVPAGESSNQVIVRASGQGRLYWSGRAEYYSSAEKLADSDLRVSRDYFHLVPAKEGEKIVHRLESFSDSSLRSGDVLAVRLTVSGGKWRYLLVEDPIPAGAEFISRDDLYEIKERPPWWESYATRREFRDDRAALFQTYFDPGSKTFFYLLKVVNPGRFRVSPARVQPMYQPQVIATTESRMMEVQ